MGILNFLTHGMNRRFAGWEGSAEIDVQSVASEADSFKGETVHWAGRGSSQADSSMKDEGICSGNWGGEGDPELEHLGGLAFEGF